MWTSDLQAFNNQYYRNIAGKPDWFFDDDACTKVGALGTPLSFSSHAPSVAHLLVHPFISSSHLIISSPRLISSHLLVSSHHQVGDAWGNKGTAVWIAKMNQAFRTGAPVQWIQKKAARFVDMTPL